MNRYINVLNLLATNDEAVAPWMAESFPIIKTVLAVLICVCSLFMIVATLLQKSEADGSQAITGKQDTFYNRNKGGSLQGLIKKLTIIDAVLLMVFCVTFLILNTLYGGY